jgi:hypothetical protein
MPTTRPVGENLELSDRRGGERRGQGGRGVVDPPTLVGEPAPRRLAATQSIFIAFFPFGSVAA